MAQFKGRGPCYTWCELSRDRMVDTCDLFRRLSRGAKFNRALTDDLAVFRVSFKLQFPS